jgi:HEAT repeat protein
MLEILLLCAVNRPLPDAAIIAPQSVSHTDDELDRLLERFLEGEAGTLGELVAVGEPAVDGLVAMLAQLQLTVAQRFMAANALGAIGSTRAVEPLIAALADAIRHERRGYVL